MVSEQDMPRMALRGLTQGHWVTCGETQASEEKTHRTVAAQVGPPVQTRQGERQLPVRTAQ